MGFPALSTQLGDTHIHSTRAWFKARTHRPQIRPVTHTQLQHIYFGPGPGAERGEQFCGIGLRRCTTKNTLLYRNTHVAHTEANRGVHTHSHKQTNVCIHTNTVKHIHTEGMSRCVGPGPFRIYIHFHSHYTGLEKRTWRVEASTLVPVRM